MHTIAGLLDRLVGRLLFVNVQNTADITADETYTAENVFRFSLMYSAGRCILQYVLLPFILPLIGLAADAALPVLIIINVLAIVSIIFSLRRFWRVGYKYRWPYLFVATTALAILAAFLIIDLQSL